MSDVLQKSADEYKPRGHLDPAGFERHVVFRTYPAPPDLVAWVDHGWTIRWEDIEGEYRSEQVMHRPYVDVFVSATGSGVQGTFRGMRTYVASGNGRIVGVRLRPGAFHALWDGPVAELQDKMVSLHGVFPEAGRGFVERVLGLEDEVAVESLFGLVRAAEPWVDANIDLINEIIAAVEMDEELQTVTAVAQAWGKSERWLQQLFKDYVGVGLKWLLLRNKLLGAAEQIRASERPNWAAIAYDAGYSSQQHFATDFKRVLGKTPLEYKKGVAI